MFEREKSKSKDFKFAKNLFPRPEELYINSLALNLYNKCSDGNSGISAEWFEFYINLYNIDEVEYLAEALHIIREEVNGFDDKLEKIKTEGEKINNEAEEIMRRMGVLEK